LYGTDTNRNSSILTPCGSTKKKLYRIHFHGFLVAGIGSIETGKLRFIKSFFTADEHRSIRYSAKHGSVNKIIRAQYGIKYFLLVETVEYIFRDRNTLEHYVDTNSYRKVLLTITETGRTDCTTVRQLLQSATPPH
jgi:hypothetical protein